MTAPRDRATLVIAFDVGTTYSGISYCHIDPNSEAPPKILPVAKFPGQDKSSADTKVPSLIYYDDEGHVRAAGFEALDLQKWVMDADGDGEEGLFKSEWFKLHLRPQKKSTHFVGEAIPPLPPNKSALDVLTDFLKYLFDCAKEYICGRNSHLPNYWENLEDHIEYVLSHPNGWGGFQQANLRKAATNAGIVSDTTEDQDRIHFVTEGEASLHYCVSLGLDKHISAKGDGVIVVDAGGGTIDISTYARGVTTDRGPSFEEITAAACDFYGSIFVTHQARVHLRAILRNSIFLDDLEHMVEAFDMSGKTRFSKGMLMENVSIKFGSMRDNEIEFGIRNGQIRISGETVASFFEPSIDNILRTILQQSSRAKHIKSVFLVGGFASNEYLFSELQDRLNAHNLTVHRPDSYLSKAVADGSLLFYLNQQVTVRVSKMAYGTRGSRTFDPSDEAHIHRKSQAYICVDGRLHLPEAYYTIVPKDRQVSAEEEFKVPFVSKSCTREALISISAHITCYRGAISNPKWTDTDADQYQDIGTITADLSNLYKNLRPRKSLGGEQDYFCVDYDIIILFGGTEMKAQYSWREKGIAKRGPATIVYHDD